MNLDFAKLKIERNIPLPPAKDGKSSSRGPLRSLLLKLKTGESVFLPLGNNLDEVRRQRSHVSVTMSTLASETGSKFASRARFENGAYGVRVWRVAVKGGKA